MEGVDVSEGKRKNTKDGRETVYNGGQAQRLPQDTISEQAHTPSQDQAVAGAGTKASSGTGGANTIKTTVNLPAEAVEALRSVAADRGTTMTEVMRHAISLE